MCLLCRIYVDCVFNQMTGWWPDGTPTTGGSTFNYGAQSYPGVPYSTFDFNDANCNSASGGIETYNDANQVGRACYTARNTYIQYKCSGKEQLHY